MRANVTDITEKLLEYATDRQRELLEAALKQGSFLAADRELNVSPGFTAKNLKAVLKRAAKEGYAPTYKHHNKGLPGFTTKRVSKAYREDGSTALEWHIQEPDKEASAELLARAISDATSNITPYPEIRRDPLALPVADLLTVYTITDYHLGMYAWDDETGGNWDMDIAETLLMKKFAEMLDGSPNSEVGVFAQLGDMLHWDGLLALTPTAKNVLDADTRFPLLVESAIRCMIWCVELLLKKHNKVHVIMAEGNHDLASSVWLRAMMVNLFRNNDRVTVDNSPHPYYVYEWGFSMLAWHHGHLSKMENLPGIFASEPRFREMWGRVKYTFIHTGHRHHQKVIERGGAVIEQHPTLSQRDAHGSRLFEISQRAAKAITYHKERGEYLRLTVTP